MIEVSFDERELSVDAEGHAGSGEVGHDIICAAVSILFQTFREVGAVGELELGTAHLRLPDGVDEAYYQFLVAGITMLAENFPDFIQIL